VPTPQPVVSWQRRLLASLEREGITDAYWRTDQNDPDFPYWTLADTELLHLEAAQRTLLEMSEGEIESLGPFAVITDVVNSGDAMPQNILKTLGARIDPTGAGKYYPASGPMEAEEWYQIAVLGAGDYNAYTILGGRVLFKGNSLKLYYLAEPVLSVFQNDSLALPAAAWLNVCLDIVHQHLAVADWLPIGRA
jgi:hypothetical protein